jgi:hypothetical protein
VKHEEVFSRINDELQEVQQALQSSHIVSIVPSTSGIEEPRDEPTQLQQITDKVEAHLRRSQKETVQATQALVKAQ